MGELKQDTKPLYVPCSTALKGGYERPYKVVVIKQVNACKKKETIIAF